MTAEPPSSPTARSGLGRFLEIQTLGLNLPFALGFLLLAAGGLPSYRTLLLVVIAFVGARNAGHSFNRWADREYDAANPRTQDRALVTGERSPRFALAFALANAGVLLVAAYFLNPLALVLAPAALGLIFGYTYSKRFSSLTTPFLGLVEAITPAAAFVAVRATLPLPVWAAVGALLAWGTAFETIHSLGDLESDRALGLHSVPLRIGPERSVRLVAALHGIALGLLGVFGAWVAVRPPYFIGIAVMAVVTGWTDVGLVRRPTEARVPFYRHITLSVIFLAGVVFALFLPPSTLFGWT